MGKKALSLLSPPSSPSLTGSRQRRNLLELEDGGDGGGAENDGENKVEEEENFDFDFVDTVNGAFGRLSSKSSAYAPLTASTSSASKSIAYDEEKAQRRLNQ